MKCNYKPPKLTKEERQEMANLKSTLPYIDRLQVDQRRWREVDYRDCDETEELFKEVSE